MKEGIFLPVMMQGTFVGKPPRGRKQKNVNDNKNRGFEKQRVKKIIEREI